MVDWEFFSLAVCSLIQRITICVSLKFIMSYIMSYAYLKKNYHRDLEKFKK